MPDITQEVRELLQQLPNGELVAVGGWEDVQCATSARTHINSKEAQP